MTFIIFVTFLISIVYFAIAFIATMRDRLMSKFPNVTYRLHLPATEIIEDPVIQPVADCSTKNIRELRAYIRENDLQELVRVTVGKNVSKCSKGELLMAIA